MPTPIDAKKKAADVYNATADFFDHPANSYWNRFGRRTVERLNLQPGNSVLDVACGSGASAIPAAEIVGPAGNVVAVDLAENLLELGRAKARDRRLNNIRFQNSDMLDLGLPDAGFDAVVCVFGIFFVPDIAAAVRELWRMVRPGGKLVVTTWGRDFFKPAGDFFWECIRGERPDLHKSFNPWDLICEPDSLRAVMRQGGVEKAEIIMEAGKHKIASAEDWWAMVMGSGLRGTVEQLHDGARDDVRDANLAYIDLEGIKEVEANVVYGIAVK
ncbi:MAG: class I SAM-dependent methyltransferase [Gammaproteobacteria bacterium]|nr:class I SAM-dependent methyltransferase [Gammaproteobacteria bacterium]